MREHIYGALAYLYAQGRLYVEGDRLDNTSFGPLFEERTVMSNEPDW
jgi:hypothetical protein